MPTPPIDLAPIIEEAAQSPLSVVSDGLEVTAQPIAAMIEADRYASAKAARARPFGGAMFAKVIPAGPVSDNQATGFGGLGRFDSPRRGGVMLGWVKSLFGPRRASPGELVRARALGAAQQAIVARYENAQNTDENARSWWLADYLSAKSANSYQVRRQLRNRSRYEVSNNAYLWGICNGNADDLVGATGPTLKCLRASDAENKRIESAWQSWCDEVGLVEKLRTIKLARTVDGEGIAVLKTVRDLEHPVKLYPVDIEADQMTSVAPKNMQELWVDGLILHPVTGRPVAYDILKSHPGDYFFPNLNPLETQRIKAKYVVHWFPKFRPGQVRGVPVFTPSLDLFSELRSFRKAVLSKAQLSANLTAVFETEAPADSDGTQTTVPFTNVPIDRGTMTTMPGGATMKPYPTGEASTTYEMYQEKCLGEAVRPLAYPLNLALGTSQKFNFSSARLDHIKYHGSVDVDRADCDRVVLDHICRVWLEEAVLIPGLLPASVRSMADVPHEWHWPGHPPLDPVADATADHARISNGTLTWREFWASRGYDWRQVMAQQDQERQEIERLGLVFGDPLKKSDTVRENIDESGDAAKDTEAARQRHGELLAALHRETPAPAPAPAPVIQVAAAEPPDLAALIGEARRGLGSAGTADPAGLTLTPWDDAPAAALVDAELARIWEQP